MYAIISLSIHHAPHLHDSTLQIGQLCACTLRVSPGSIAIQNVMGWRDLCCTHGMVTILVPQRSSCLYIVSPNLLFEPVVRLTGRCMSCVIHRIPYMHASPASMCCQHAVSDLGGSIRARSIRLHIGVATKLVRTHACMLGPRATPNVS